MNSEAQVRQYLNEFANAIEKLQIEKQFVTDNGYRELRNRIISTYTAVIGLLFK